MEKIKNSIQELLDRIFIKDKKGSDNDIQPLGNVEKYPKEDIEYAKNLAKVFDSIRANERRNEQQADAGELLDKINYEEAFALPDKNKKSIVRKLMRIAAVLLPLAIISTLIMVNLDKPSDEAFQQIYVPKGSKTKLVLDDGTKLWLNSESELRYPSSFKSRKKRDVYLTGEAYFDVAKNKDKPFRVHTSGFKINVLGTAFNVKAYPQDETIEATLEHGIINIEKTVHRPDKKKSALTQLITLKPNQTIVLYKNDDEMHIADDLIEIDNRQNRELLKEDEKPLVKKAGVLKNVDTSPYTSWKENKLIFKSKTLEELLPELERWYNIEIELADASLDSIKCTGTFENETAEQAIHALCTASGITYEIEKNHVILKLEYVN